MDQLDLPFHARPPEPAGPEPAGASPEAALAARLAVRSPGPLEVCFGRARRHPVQLEQSRAADGSVRRRLKLHAAFAAAPPEVVEALGVWMRSGRRARRASRTLDTWIAEAVPTVEPRRLPAPEARGTHHDLDRIGAAVVAEPTAGPVHGLDPVPPLGWGRWPTRPPRRRIQLGAWDPNGRVVRVHPVLDDPKVPGVCLRFVVFHELLHATLELPDGEGAHGPAFRRVERAFVDHAEATGWIDRTSAALVERVARRVRRRRR